MGKTRSFVVTQWNIDCDYLKLVEGGQLQFVAYGEEECPTTGRKHHQAFIYFQNQRSDGKRNLCKIGKMFGKTHCNVEPMRGSFKQNVAYCSKESELIKIGDEPKQGERGDLNEVKEMILSGKRKADDICEADPAFFHQYGRTLDRLEVIALRKKWRKWRTKGVWYTGPTGSGKSHAAFQDYDPETHYVKNLNEEWWDGYRGQPIVILNEFRGQLTFSELLDLVDEWPKSVKWRGRESVPFLAEKVIITSIKRPEECYPRISEANDEPWEQFSRRFEVITLTGRDDGDDAF